MLLIFPPAAKPSEPPAGIAKIAAALKAHGHPCQVLDANLEGMLVLLGGRYPALDTWSRRAVRKAASHLADLRDPGTYQSLDRYTRAVRDIQRVLEISARGRDVVLGLADYHHRRLTPVRSADLIAAAEHPEQNPFFPWFSRRLPEFMNAISSRRPQESRGGYPDRDTVNVEEPVIGFSLNYLSQALCTFAMAGFIKREFPGASIVLGGGLVTSWMKRPGWINPFSGLVDHLIEGPGEVPLLRLLGLDDIRQDHFLPDYEMFPVDDYLSPGFVLPYSASRGCYWNKCSFCPEPAEGGSYSAVPAVPAAADLRTLTGRTRPVLIHMLDNAVSPAFMHALADEPPGAPWYGFARISDTLKDLDFCRALKRSGCDMLKLGLESGDQGVLDRLQKGIDLETASRVLHNLKTAGIAAYVYLLFGTPAETLHEARQTLDFIVRHGDAVTFLNLAIFNMPLCGQGTGECETGRFYEGDLSLYTGFKHPRGWDRKQVRLFLDAEFKRHPVISSILKNDPPLFTSNHAAFFLRR